MDIQSDLDNAIAYASKGDFNYTFSILRGILKRKPDNEKAWLLLSEYFESPMRKILCLEQVLRINPHNDHAQNSLLQLKSEVNGFNLPKEELKSEIIFKKCPKCSENIRIDNVVCWYCGYDFNIFTPSINNEISNFTKPPIHVINDQAIDQIQIHQNVKQKIWSSFIAGNELLSLKLIAQLAGWKNLDAWVGEFSWASKGATYLRSYHFSALQNIPEETRKEFALVVAWRSMLSIFKFDQDSGRREIENKLWVWDKTESLASIIGHKYILKIDAEAIIQAIFGKSYFSNSGNHLLDPFYSCKAQIDMWPKLQFLPSLSITARTAFIRAVRYVDKYGLVIFTRIGPSGISELEDGLKELSDAGLIELTPNPSQIITDLLMMNLALKDLKNFAFKHGVKPYGSKYQVVKSIVEHVDEREIKTLLNKINDERYLRILLP